MAPDGPWYQITRTGTPVSNGEGFSRLELLRSRTGSQVRPPTPHTCMHCQAIKVHLPGHMQRWVERIALRKQGNLFEFDIIEGSQVLEHSDSCMFFKWAIEGLKQKYGDVQIDDGWKLSGGIPYQYLERGSSDVPYVVFLWYHWSDGKRDDTEYAKLSMLSVLAEDGDPASKIIPRRPGARSQFSDIHPEVLREFLSDCHNRHDVCNKSMDSRMPTYLIEILDDPISASDPVLRLVYRPPGVDYAALSYCWGGDQKVKLTLSTIAEFTGAVQYSLLPKTLQDAVITAQMLGLKFLWIDALCVVQDDAVHIAREIAMMPSIYQNAYITIYAARASGADQGFLDDIVTPSTSSHSFQFGICTPDELVSTDMNGQIEGDYFIPNIVGSVICFCDLDESNVVSPIERRGWTFQEYLLSPRILEFGMYQTSFKCLKFELRNSGHESLDYGKRAERLTEFRSKFHNFGASDDSEGRSAIPLPWEVTVAHFAQREISNPRDRLRAISGVATVQGYHEGGTYLAGLWKEHLSTQLQWEAVGTKPRPAEYRAPSWSWASVDEDIDFHGGVTPEMSGRDLQVLDARIDLKDQSAPYGEVDYGSLTVRGWVKQKKVVNGGKSLANLDWEPDDHENENERELPWGCLGQC
ncbi:hypothetical protein PG995_005975 [Apiospora arundinis]